MTATDETRVQPDLVAENELLKTENERLRTELERLQNRDEALIGYSKKLVQLTAGKELVRTWGALFDSVEHWFRRPAEPPRFRLAGEAAGALLNRLIKVLLVRLLAWFATPVLLVLQIYLLAVQNDKLEVQSMMMRDDAYLSRLESTSRLRQELMTTRSAKQALARTTTAATQAEHFLKGIEYYDYRTQPVWFESEDIYRGLSTAYGSLLAGTLRREEEQLINTCSYGTGAKISDGYAAAIGRLEQHALYVKTTKKYRIDLAASDHETTRGPVPPLPPSWAFMNQAIDKVVPESIELCSKLLKAIRAAQDSCANREASLIADLSALSDARSNSGVNEPGARSPEFEQ